MTDADVRKMRTAISTIRRKLGDDAESHGCTFTQLRVGYRMPKGETQNGRIEMGNTDDLAFIA